MTKSECFLSSHYSENDGTAPKKVKLDFGRPGKFEIYLVDKDHKGELIKTTSKTAFKMPVHFYILLKEI